MRLDLPTLLCAFLLALVLPACRSTSRDFQFYPAPLEILVQADSGDVLARALLSVQRGVQPDASELPRMLTRLRIENETDEVLELLPERLLLVDDETHEFGPAEVVGDTSIAPRGTTTFELAFPYPRNVSLHAPNLRGLNLRLTLRHTRGETTATGTLERALPPPHGGGDVRWGFGYATTF